MHAEKSELEALRAALGESGGVDFGAALASMGGDRKLLDEVAQVFLREAPRQLERLRAALAAGDTGAARLEAHTLKGSLGTIAAHEAQQTATRLETVVATGGRVEDCWPLYDRLAVAAGAALGALRSHKAEAT